MWEDGGIPDFTRSETLLGVGQKDRVVRRRRVRQADGTERPDDGRVSAGSERDVGKIGGDVGEARAAVGCERLLVGGNGEGEPI